MPQATVPSRAATHSESMQEIADFNRISKQELVCPASKSRDMNYGNIVRRDGSFASNRSELQTSQLFENGPTTVAYRDNAQRQPTKEEIDGLIYRRFSPEYAEGYSASGTKL